MKIAIAGSHGTGKSTFAKALVRRLNFRYIPDIVREEAAPRGFVINENTPPEVQLWLVMRQWELEKTTTENWVTDKNLFDYLVYGEIVLRDKTIKQVIREIIKHNAKYDFVFYLPIEFPMELDGLRSADLEFQKEVDTRYRQALEEFKVRYFILSGPVKERLNQALRYLRGSC